MINKYKKKKIPEEFSIFVIFFAITEIRRLTYKLRTFQNCEY